MSDYSCKNNDNKRDNPYFFHTSTSKGFTKIIRRWKIKNIFLQGLTASATPMLFAALAYKQAHSFLFVMNDNDEAGYFYNDLKTMLAPEDDAEPLADVLFFPSSYRRAIKYGQCDAGNEILRTEVLTKLAAIRTNLEKGKPLTPLFIVSEPSAIAELVVSQRQLDERRLTLTVDQHINIVEVGKNSVNLVFQKPIMSMNQGNLLFVEVSLMCIPSLVRCPIVSTFW